MNELGEIIEDIRAELAGMENLRQELRSLRDLRYPGVHRAWGSILHDFYTGCERIFLRIARDIDRDLPQGEHWHIDLLSRIETDRGQIRPEVISEDLARALRPYLGFRHVFRNIYGYELQADRLHPLIEHFDETLNRFQAELKTFLAFLEEVRSRL